MNTKGVPPRSPGLRGTRYPGYDEFRNSPNPERVVTGVQAAMKRLLKYNSLVAVAFLLLWALVDIAIVIIGENWFLTSIGLGSFPLVFLALLFANWRALRHSSKHPVGFAILASITMSPVFIVIGIIFIKKFRLLIGSDW